MGDTERMIGDAAKNQAAMNPANTVFDAKRLIGRRWSDSATQSDMKHFPFGVIQKDGDRPSIRVTFKGEEKDFFPEEISAMILTKMKEVAEAFLGKDAEKYAEEDAAFKNKVESKNSLENYCYSMKNTLDDVKVKVKGNSSLVSQDLEPSR